MTDDVLLDEPDAIVGASGAGKSYTAREKVERLLRAKRHVIIFDPTGVWYGLQSDAAGTGPGFDIPVFGGPRANWPVAPDQGGALAGLLLDQRVSAVLDVSCFEEAELRRFALDFLAPLRHRERVNLHLVFDEAEEFAPQTVPDDVGFQLVRQMIWIAKRGRVFGLVPTFITQRPADFAKAVLSQVQTLYFHQLIAPADQAPVRAYLKANADAATLKSVEGSLAELGRGERWIYAPRHRILERGVTPTIATFDSMATPAPGEAKREPRTLAQLDVSAIGAALNRATAHPDDIVPADPTEAGRRGSVVGTMLKERDDRIAELEAILADRDVQLATVCEDHQRAVTFGRQAHLALIDIGRSAIDRAADISDELGRALGLAVDDDGNPSSSDPAPPVEADPPVGHPRRAGQAVAGREDSGPPPAAATPPDVAALVEAAKSPRGATLKVAGPPKAIRGRKALAVLARISPAGLTEVQWAGLAGYARTGGTWNTYRSELRRDGLVVQDGDLWHATVAGVFAAAVPAEPLPEPGPALATFWGERIPGCRRIVQVLVKRSPHWTTRDGLAADVGMTATGGAFLTYLGRLRANGLLQEQGKRLRLAPAIMGFTP